MNYTASRFVAMPGNFLLGGLLLNTLPFRKRIESTAGQLDVDTSPLEKNTARGHVLI